MGSIVGVNLDFKRRRSYALVGESGSGKSTVLGLIRGTLKAQSAVVYCDQQKQEFALAHVAHHSTLIPQEPEIFSDSIKFNITMDVEAEEEDIFKAVKLARFDTVLARLPKGLLTNLAEKGVNLSGGEKQRLALARGLFFAEESDSDLILLDEPTSSVDKLNERRIYQNLLQHFKDRCIVSAVHNFELLRLFDEVLVFRNGSLVEQGSVDQLLKTGCELYRLWHGDSVVNY